MMRISEWAWRLGLAALAGIGIFLGFPPVGSPLLAWGGLVPLLLSVRGTSGRVHILLGLCTGTIANLGILYWVTGLLVNFGHMSIILAAFLNLLLAILQGSIFAIWLWLFHRLRLYRPLDYWLLAPITYIASESLVWCVFPWFYANTQFRWVPVIQICELGGVYLLGFFLVMANGAWMDMIESIIQHNHLKALRYLALASALPALLTIYGSFRIHMLDARVASAPNLAIGVVQANIGIRSKESREKVDDNLVIHQRLSLELANRGADLILWPETSYYSSYVFAQTEGQQGMQGYRLTPRNAVRLPQSATMPPKHAVEDRARQTPLMDRAAPQRGFQIPLLFGATTFRENRESRSIRHPGTDRHNSAILLDRQGRVAGIYDKMHLMTFSEHIPLGGMFPILYQWTPETSDITPGKSFRAMPFGPYRLGVLICYEDILPQVGRRLSAEKPNILLNLTNDAWFGETAEPYTHVAVSVFRAVENRLALVRSTNTGISCFIDPCGRILSQTRLSAAETLMEKMPMLESASFYQQSGDWPAWDCILSVTGLWFGNYSARNRLIQCIRHFSR